MHNPECEECTHPCPWQGNPIGAPFCTVCDDHNERRTAGIESFASEALSDYRVCLVWQSYDPATESQISPDVEWSQEALSESESDVADFISGNWQDVKGLDPGQVGHDFCLTRNRHGAGFWDRGLGELGDRLTEASHPYGTQSGYIGDDGLLYLHG